MDQKTEALYLINGDRFLHLRENGAVVGFATYDCANGAPLESGQISKWKGTRYNGTRYYLYR